MSESKKGDDGEEDLHHQLAQLNVFMSVVDDSSDSDAAKSPAMTELERRRSRVKG